MQNTSIYDTIHVMALKTYETTQFQTRKHKSTAAPKNIARVLARIHEEKDSRESMKRFGSGVVLVSNFHVADTNPDLEQFNKDKAAGLVEVLTKIAHERGVKAIGLSLHTDEDIQELSGPTGGETATDSVPYLAELMEQKGWTVYGATTADAGDGKPVNSHGYTDMLSMAGLLSSIQETNRAAAAEGNVPLNEILHVAVVGAYGLQKGLDLGSNEVIRPAQVFLVK